VKDPAAVVKPQQKVMVTVVEVDLARNRIALSMRSKPQIGGSQPGEGGGGQGGARPGGPRSPGQRPGPGQDRRPAQPQTLNGDWFSQAMQKKR
jgi:uncharacterized protein